MKLGVRIAGDIARIMEAETRGGEKAVTHAMRDAGTGLKNAWRTQITGAGLGNRLARTIRSQAYPKGRQSLNAAALVWSKAPVIVSAHDTGPLIRSKSGFWLTIPMPEAGKSRRGGKMTPSEWERRTGMRLRFVYRRSGPSLLVADNVRVSKRGRVRENITRHKDGRVSSRLKGRATAVIFILVPQVKLPKRLDLDRDAERTLDSVPGLIVANWVEGKL